MSGSGDDDDDVEANGEILSDRISSLSPAAFFDVGVGCVGGFCVGVGVGVIDVGVGVVIFLTFWFVAETGVVAVSLAIADTHVFLVAGAVVVTVVVVVVLVVVSLPLLVIVGDTDVIEVASLATIALLFSLPVDTKDVAVVAISIDVGWAFVGTVEAVIFVDVGTAFK